MAKYVGKVFKVSNNKLGIRNSGAHNVHVTWYNPLKRKFRCKVITSLESEETLVGKQRKKLNRTPYVKKPGTDDDYYLFKRGKYRSIRNGNLTPIPITKVDGLSHWSAYSDTVELTINDLKKSKEQSDIKIRK